MSFSTGKKETIGFIGLGNMGGSMAKNLHKAGYNLSVYDISKDSVTKLISTFSKNSTSSSIKSASTPQEVAQNSSIIITMLPSSPHVLEVYNGEKGLLKGAKKGTFFIDSSTIDPSVAREVAQNVRDKVGGKMVDAPVSGGVLAADAGTLTFMVGGDDVEFNQAKEILQHMGKNIVHCGGVGNGQVVKICNNLVLGISMIGVSEAFNLGIALGMDPKVMANIFKTSTARCWSTDTYNPVPGVMEGVPASRGYTGGFGVNLMAKDLGLAISSATKLKTPVPLGSQALQIYNILGQVGDYGGKDFSSVFEFLSKGDKEKGGKKEK